MQKIVVTGGAGFIGSHITDALLDLGYQLTILDDLSSGHPQNLVSARSKGGELVHGSILDQQGLDRALAGADGVSHLAAIPSVPRSIDEPLLSHEVNSTGTLKLLEACRRNGIRALTSPAVPGRTLNVCSGRSCTIRELAEMVARALGVPVSMRFTPARKEDVRNVRGDPTLGKELLGFEASTSLEEGLRTTADWFRLHIGPEEFREC